MKRLLEYFRYLKLKMLKDRLPPARVAAGWALGMFVGCTIPFGLQLIVSVPLSFALKVSKFGATLGTFITNPFTIVFIYPVQIWVGAYLLGSPLGCEEIRGYCERLTTVSLVSAEGWRTLMEIGGAVVGGFLLGGLLLALVCTPITYFGVKRLVETHRRRKGKKEA
ncbi:MAG: DUF2062 domain-containing protein [Kiritimatiellia bacterium]